MKYIMHLKHKMSKAELITEISEAQAKLFQNMLDKNEPIASDFNITISRFDS